MPDSFLSRLAIATFASLVLAAACAGMSGVAVAAPSYDVFTTSRTEHGRPLDEPETQFGCSDQVFAVMDASGVDPGRYQVEVVWRDPTGTEREHTTFEVQVRRERERVWAWLKLHAPRGSTVMQVFEPSYGMDEFIGTWEARFLLNGERVAAVSFEVLC